MTQPPNPTHAHPDARIDQVLHALRTTEAPSGLEERVAQRLTARLAHTAEARTPTTSFFAATDGRTTPSPFATTARRATPSALSATDGRTAPSLFAVPDAITGPSFFAVILNAVKDPRIFFADAMPYALPATALILLLAIVSITFHTHQPPHTTALSKPTPSHPYAPAQPASLTPALAPPNLQATQLTAIANTTVPQGFSLESSIPANVSELSTPPTDPDAIALAETLAPSRPAPLMPLTPQENLLLAATRPGQPIEIAELEPLREPALRAAAEAHQHASRRQYLQALLAPLVFAQALEPTSPSPPQDEAQSAVPSESPSSK